MSEFIWFSQRIDRVPGLDNVEMNVNRPCVVHDEESNRVMGYVWCEVRPTPYGDIEVFHWMHTTGARNGSAAIHHKEAEQSLYDFHQRFMREAFLEYNQHERDRLSREQAMKYYANVLDEIRTRTGPIPDGESLVDHVDKLVKKSGRQRHTEPGVVDYEYEASRWEEDISHHPMSVALMEWMKDVDFNAFDDHMCLKTGGDGDNGETLMFLMDGFFERGLHKE